MTETELRLLIDFHLLAQRQGPGSDTDTLRALDFVNQMSVPNLNIADIGCGTGAQTMVLAHKLNGNITAVDLFPEFLDILRRQAAEQGVSDRINTLQASMDNLPFSSDSLDLIWSEGAIYNIGFEAGITYWKSFLNSGGFLALSELTWKTNKRRHLYRNTGIANIRKWTRCLVK